MMPPGSRGKIRPDGRRFTLVSFHAHPDDESLLTGGSLAKASAEGHRVVLVTATSGERGLAGPQDGHGADLARVRTAELEHAAAALGCARVVNLGYGDSGLHPDPSDSAAFAHVDVATAAARLAEVLREEDADALTVYDPNGGYGHPDHVHVHRVGVAAARLAGTPVVLEATVSAGLFRSVLLAMRLLGHALGRSAPLGTAQVFSSSRRITHRIRVGEHLMAKREALAAHGSQRRSDGPRRSIDYFLALPGPVFALVFGREWFVEHGRDPASRRDDLFATLRSGSGTEAGAP
jgi:LmbE family N-acetylglucosaminyl deacetylase